MANQSYLHGQNHFLTGGIDVSSDTIKALLATTGYVPNITTDEFLSIISGGNIVAAGVALTSKTTSGGTLSAANLVWTAVSGSAASYIVIYKDTGSSATSPLIGIIDTASGLPVTPNGGDITVAWAGGAVFTLFQGIEGGISALWKRAKHGLYIPAPRVIQAPPDRMVYVPKLVMA